jgi:hypothetical protein
MPLHGGLGLLNLHGFARPACQQRSEPEYPGKVMVTELEDGVIHLEVTMPPQGTAAIELIC